MNKIQFWLKKNDTEPESLEYITIDNPKIDETERFPRGDCYICEIYFSDIKKTIPVYGINPIETLCLAAKFARNYLKGLIKGSYTINEVASHELWKLEKLSDNFLQEEIDKIKSNKNLSQEDKDKIFGILKETFGKSPSPIKDQVNELKFI